MMDALDIGRPVRAVAIGASAGGVDSLMRLLPELPAASPIPVFAVLHLPAGRPSLLPDIFGRRCALKVCEAEDKMPVDAGIIYFAPPDYHLLVDKGPAIALSVDDPVCYSRPSIDVLFESAAAVYGADLLAVVLSGASEDGVRGAAAVAAAGGMMVVQTPSEAVVPTLPAAVLREVRVDRVCTLTELQNLFRNLGAI